jgi:sec-independent protein translocase protein TatA
LRENLEAMGAIGPSQIILIALIVLLLFGGKKIPELMRGLGKGVKEFKDATNNEERDDRKDD